jgi:outer membrane protein OmpA-like peptidoglycan-associated protein
VVFTSDSNRTPSVKAYQKVYVLNGDSISSFSPVMNDNLYHDGAVTFSPDGDTAYFSVTNPGSLHKKGDKLKYQDHGRTVTVRLRRLELWWTARDSSGHWSPAQPFPYNNPEKYSLGQATLDPSGRILYFASDMPGGYGKTDIWYCERQSDGSWGKPVNCGPQVNTADEEAFPYVGADGVLYFASKGHAGMGGFDVYAATGADSTWTSVANLKYPINSPGDDFFYTIKDSLSGYVSSDRPGGKGGDDIYTYTRPATKAPVATATPADTTKNLAATPNSGLNGTSGAPGTGSNGVTPDSTATNGATPNVTAPKLIILKTHVIDKLTRQPLTGALVTVAKEGGEALSPTAEPAKGLTIHVLDPNTHFLDSAAKDGYISDGVSVSTDGVTAPDTLNVNLYLLKQPTKGDIFVLHNVYFDFNMWNIRSDAAEELDRVVAYMKQYPSVVIDLSAHTDSRGEDDFNMRLSIKRARSARWYLHQHGIAWERITYHGYGETRLVNGCSNDVPCTEEEHQANRRVEVKILHQ